MNTFLKYVEEYIKSDNCKYEIEQLENENIFDENNHVHFNNWLNKIGKEKRNEFFTKVKQKYDSKKYKDREFRKGKEPEELLCHYILDYGRKFGDSVKDDENVELIYDEFIIDKTWKISCIWGQSCFYSLEKI